MIKQFFSILSHYAYYVLLLLLKKVFVITIVDITPNLRMCRNEIDLNFRF